MKLLLLALCGLTIGCAARAPLSDKQAVHIMAPYRDDGLARALMDLEP